MSLELLKRRKDKFWSNVKKTRTCWIWQKGLNNNGYGKYYFKVSGKIIAFYAHRAAWQLSNNKVIPDGMIVMHKCDIPNCVNPKHLRLGTLGDNVRDCRDKGRLVTPIYKGEKHPLSKLTKEQVLNIRKDYRDGIRIYKLAIKYGIHKYTVSGIVHRKQWRHI